MEIIRGFMVLLYLCAITFGIIDVWRQDGFAAALVFFVAINVFIALVIALSDTARSIASHIFGK